MNSAESGIAAHCESVVKIYRSATEETHALRGVDVSILAGVLTVVAGPSGSGKSSLLRLLAARDRPSAGKVEVLGVPVSTASSKQLTQLRRRAVAHVAQRASSALLPTLTAAEHVQQVGRWRRVQVDAATALDTVGLAHRGDHRPGELSGGEQQRLTVVLALLGKPRLVVADEPTAELDSENAEHVLQALHAAAAAGAAVVVSSHDPRVIDHADRVLRLRHGVLSSETARQGTATAVLDSIGRIQLPAEVLGLFPGGRVLVERDGDGLRLRPPDAPEADR